MKLSEYIQKLIEIEEQKDSNVTITMSYLDYLEEKKKLIEREDVELK